LKRPRAGQPGEHPPFLGLHLLAQLAGLDVVVADKTNVGDLDLRAFLDLENDGAEAGGRSRSML
jgi:hypothetical protein